jgi:signal transduction histidine kinase
VSLTGRLVLGTGAAVTLALIVLIWGVEATVHGHLERDARRTLTLETRLAGDLTRRDSTTWRAGLERLSAQSGHTISLADSTGHVLAVAGPRVHGDSLSARERRGAITVTVSAPTSDLLPDLGRLRRLLVLLAVVALLGALVLARFLGRSIATPIGHLAASARAIAGGSATPPPVMSLPELEELARALREAQHTITTRADALRRGSAEGSALVDAMTEGVIAADGRGGIVRANPAARRLLGYGADAPLPPLATLFRTKAAREVVDAVLAGDTVADRVIELDDRQLSLNARPVAGGGVVLVLHDLTTLRRLEAIRRDFVANVSHELKTPLTSIAGYAETLTDPTLDAGTRERFLGTVIANARRMQRLVDDLLDLSRIESGRWGPEARPTDVAAVATEAWAPFQDRAASRGVALDLAVAPDATRVLAEPASLRDVLSNLFDNALRYAPEGSRIVCRSERQGGGTDLSVSDRGSGIPAEHLPRIFERFYRVDPSRSRAEGGTGLGLAIVKHLIEAHGGRVRAESALREGTTIHCWLPDAPVP